MILPWHLYLMAFIYMFTGINHLRKPEFYIKIIPWFFPNRRLLNIISGLFEIILGILLCIPSCSKYAAFGIIALLLVTFPANIFMYSNISANPGIPKWILILRLPLQIVLIIWAYQYTFFIH